MFRLSMSSARMGARMAVAAVTQRMPPSAPLPHRLGITASVASARRTFASQSVRSVKELQDLVESSKDRLVVVEWKASWCGKCKVVATELERAEKLYGPNMLVLYADIDENDLKVAKEEAGIEHLPTLHFIKNDDLVHSITGVRTSEMKDTIAKYCQPA